MAMIATPMGPPKNAMDALNRVIAEDASKVARLAPVMLAVMAVWNMVRRTLAT